MDSLGRDSGVLYKQIKLKLKEAVGIIILYFFPPSVSWKIECSKFTDIFHPFAETAIAHEVVQKTRHPIHFLVDDFDPRNSYK